MTWAADQLSWRTTPVPKDAWEREDVMIVSCRHCPWRRQVDISWDLGELDDAEAEQAYAEHWDTDHAHQVQP